MEFRVKIDIVIIPNHKTLVQDLVANFVIHELILAHLISISNPKNADKRTQNGKDNSYYLR